MTTKKKIKKSLPHGYLTKVAKAAGVSKSAVTRYLNGSVKSSPRIEKAAIECVLEYKNTITPLLNKLNRVS